MRVDTLLNEYRMVTMQQTLGLVRVLLEDGYTLEMVLNKIDNVQQIVESLPDDDHKVIILPDGDPRLYLDLGAIAEAMKAKHISEATWYTHPNGTKSLRTMGDREHPPVISYSLDIDGKGGRKTGVTISTGLHDEDELPMHLELCKLMFSSSKLLEHAEGQITLVDGLVLAVMDIIQRRRPDWVRL